MKLRSAALVLAFVVAAVTAPAVAASVTLPTGAITVPTSGTFLYLNSEAGDWVGRGIEQLYTQSVVTEIIATLQGPEEIRVQVNQGEYAHFWTAWFAAPYGQGLSVGSYTGAVRALGGQANEPGLSVSGDSHGCNIVSGQFDVSALQYSTHGELLLFDATFEQHCEGGSPALYGRVRIEIPEPTPGVTLPSGSIAVPTSGNFLYLNSDYRDYVGGGIEQLYTSSNSKFTGSITEAGGYFRGSVIQGNYAHWWYVDIAAPPGEALAIGSYIRAKRAAFRPAGSPGLDIYGDGRGCEANGKFDIDELSISPAGRLLVFQVTFEQHCDAHTAALHGRLRYEYVPSPPGVTLPQGSIAIPTSGSFLYLNSEPGGYVGGGVEQLYTAADSTVTGSMTTDIGDYFRGHVAQGNNVHYWYVDVAAPPGQPLAVGSYVDAVRASFRPVGTPGLDVWGDGRGYNDLTGKFDVNELSVWPNGDLKVFQATFQIGDFSPRLYGRVRIETTPPLQLGVTIREEGSVTNKSIVATIAGTVLCSRAATAQLTVTLRQVQAKGVTVTGNVTVPIDCTAPSVVWSQSIWPENGAFKAGSATAVVSATACEPERHCVSASTSRAVKLNVGKP